MKHRLALWLAFPLCLIFSLQDIPAQVANADNNKVTKAVKIDEFGWPGNNWSAVMAYLDHFAQELQTNPTARAFIVAYRGTRDLPGLSSRWGWMVNNYLMHNRGLETGRVVVIDGGELPSFRVELWMVPFGATPPIAEGKTDLNLWQALKYDVQNITLPTEPGEYIIDPRLEGFASVLQSKPTLRGYLIAYNQHRVVIEEDTNRRGRTVTRRRLYHDAPDTAMRLLQGYRRRIIEEYRLAPGRIKLINGGYRRWRQVELWLVPPGAEAPEILALPIKRR